MAKTKAENLEEKVEAVLTTVRPGIEAHGGGLELVEVKGKTAKIRIQGACVGCPMAQATFDEGVRRLVLKEVQGVEEVEFVE